MVHLQDLIPADRSINCLPFIPLGDSPIIIAMPPPVQLGNTLFHALDESTNRAHAVLRVLRAALEWRQGDDAVIYDDSNLLGRGEGGVCAGQHCSREMVEKSFVEKRSKGNLHWNWMLVAKGASCEERKDLFSGM